MSGPVLRVRCEGRLAAIAQSLRAVAPVTLAELYRVDRATFVVVAAEVLGVVADRSDVDETRMGAIVIEVDV